MATTREVGDSEISDDSISLTSTVVTNNEGDYEVECILAERNESKGTMEYLTAWKDYPETAHTWEPRENFYENDVFCEWANTKKRVAKGLEKPFDVKAWEKRCKAIEKETDRRMERRRIKKLRLIKHDECASGLGKQDANIESSGSNSAPKRSDKRIKRRSVHQDSPPSSSTSSPPSDSVSEDSDRPLVSRQKSEMFAPDPKWTQAETVALEEGLQILKGPRWRELLSLFGRNGTRNQVLKKKAPSDLYDKAKSVRQEFIDSGREPPEYLKVFSKPTSSQGSRTATPNTAPNSRGQSRAVSKKSNRSASADSMMAELYEKQRIRESNNRENSRPQQNIKSKEITNHARGRREESNTAKKISGDKPNAPQTSQALARKAKKAVANEIPNEGPQAAQITSHSEMIVLHTKRTIEVQEGSNSHSRRGSQLKDGPRAREPSQFSADPQVERQPESRTSSVKQIASPAINPAIEQDISHTAVPETNEIVYEGTGRTNWSGTARAQIARPSASNPSRGEAAGSGQNRPNSSKLKPKLGQIEPKKPIVTGDVTAAWNLEPKKRKSNNWATQNADPVDGQPAKRSYKLSVQNRIFKSRREGRAPDPNRLVFIDPKTGKAPKTVSAPSATAMLSKTPLQLHQEELATREAEERQAQEAENAMPISTSEPDPPPPAIDQNHETRNEEQEEPEFSKSLSNASKSALNPTTDDMTEGSAHNHTLTSPPMISPHPDPPSSVPLGPRVETKRMATMSLQDYTERLKPSTRHMSGAITKPSRHYSSDDLSIFTLRSYPSIEHKKDIFSKIDSNLVIGDIKLGENDQESINVRFVGFGSEVKKLLLTIKIFPRTVDFVFKTVCLASEYKAYFPAEPSDYLGSGSILSYHHSESAVENIVETLANNMQGGLFFAQQYTMLMYPAGASAWAFLDNNVPTVHPGTALRFVLRKPLPPVPVDVRGLAAAQLSQTRPQRYMNIKTKLQNYPVQAEEKNINIVFRDMFEIEFSRLVAQNGPQQHPPTNIFFLCFIPQGCDVYEPNSAKRSALRMRTSEEHDLFIKFLQANGAEDIYSVQAIGSQEIDNNGAWDYFCKHVKSGTIIFHDAFIRYDLVPRLAKHLLHGSVNVWKTSLSPMHPSEKHSHLVRLFPHGGVLLLTGSLILYQPRETLRILMWFRRVHVPGKAPGTWKLAVRPRVREWLLDIIEAYSDTGKDIFGCGIQLFADIYTEIYWLLQTPDHGDSGLMCHEWDYEIPTDEAPLVSSASLHVLQARREWKGEGADIEPDDDHIRQNDDLLAQWFAEWAIVNLPNFRKYHVILGYAKDHPFTATAISAYEKAWGHIEVMTSEEAFMRHKITPQSKLDEMEAERRRRLKEQLPAKKAAAQRARREEREAARLALAIRMQLYRDVGATEEEVLKAGRQLLSDLGGSEKEIEECRVDMDRVFVDRWWEEGPVTAGDVDVDMNEIDTTEAAHGMGHANMPLPRT